MPVMIGVDPHKASHTAVAIDDKERLLGEVRVRSSADQVTQLRAWAGQVAQAGLGRRRCRRPRLPAGPATGLSGRNGAGRATQTGLACPPVGDRQREQVCMVVNHPEA